MQISKSLTSQQWEELFAFIKAVHLNESEFQMLERPTKFGRRYKVSQLFHLPTKHYFLFDQDQDGYFYLKYSFGKNRAIESEFAGSFKSVLKTFEKWIQTF